MTIISATAVKESAESKVGIAFSRANYESPLTVKLVREGGLFDGSDLRQGMTIISINGQEMTWKTPKEAATVLRNTEGGEELSIEARVMIGTIHKAEKTETLGLSLKNSTKMPGIFVSKIAETSKFQGSELAVGQRVLYINDQECPNDTKAAITLVKEAEGELTIIATETDLVPPEPEDPPTKPDAAVESPKAPTPVHEEKKEEPNQVVDDQDLPDVEELEEEEKQGGLLDTMFKACIC